MSFIDKLFNKPEEKEEKIYTVPIEKELEEKGIPYDLEEDEEEGYHINYVDPFENLIYQFKYNENYSYNNKPIEEKEIIRLLDVRWKKDSMILKYMDDENYEDIFDIKEFFSNIVSEKGLIDNLIPGKNKISLYYNLRTAPTEENYMAGIEQTRNGLMIITESRKVSANEAVLYILQRIYEEVPLYITSGNYKEKQNTKFTDIVKTYLIDLALINRINDVTESEAQITDVGKSNIVFVMFKNGAAIKYITPTKQAPKGKLLMMDYDEENLVEDNEDFELVSRILKLSSLINSKPDEDKMPKRNFNNSSEKQKRRKV